MCITNQILALPYTHQAWMGLRNQVPLAHAQQVYLVEPDKVTQPNLD